jgi:hypothetical protein
MSDQQQPSIQSIHDLFQTAQAGPGKKGLSRETTEILVQNLTPVTLPGTQGASYDTLGGDKALLFVPLLDMTGSMTPFRQDVINAYNAMISTLKKSKQADQMLMSAWTFNRQSMLLHSYTPMEFVPLLDRNTYRPNDQTALYDAILSATVGMVAYGQDLRNSGVRTRMTLVVFTDGADNSSRNTAAQVRQVVTDLLAQEMYTFVLVGFGKGSAQRTAQQIGFNNVMEADADPSAIRRALDVVSQSLIRNSQTTITNTAPNAFFH